MLLCALGDVVLDVVVRLRAPLAAGGDADAEIGLFPGGQAANVAAWAAALGASARLVAKRGPDPAGELVRAGLEARGVQLLGPVEGRTGVVCSLVTPDGERSLASDRAAAAALSAEEIDPAWLAGCDHLFLSGYALLREPARAAALRAAALAREQGAAVSVDLASWSAIVEAGPAGFRRAVEEAAPDAVFATEREEEAAGGPLPGARRIVKLGPRGCRFDGELRPAEPVPAVVDPTGAGDALAAGFIVGGPELALWAAARCVQRLGAMP